MVVRDIKLCLFLFLVTAALHCLPGLAAQASEIKPAGQSVGRRANQSAAYTLAPEKLKVAVAYTRRRTVLGFAETGWAVAQLFLLLASGLAARMRNAAASMSRYFAIQGFLFFLLFSAATDAMSLPLEAYGHHLGLAYGQSVQTWGSWFGDHAKGFLLNYVVGALLVLLLFWVIGRSPDRWWFWFWIPAMASVVFGIFLAPVLVDPLFNDFEPLARSNPELVGRLEQVVARGGLSISPDRMYLMKASDKVTGLNAYVTGIGASKRVVVWDTTIAKASPDEISFIFGHEMGHYVLNHIYKGITFAGFVLVAFFWSGFHGVRWMIRQYGEAWQIPDQRDWAALVVIMLVLSVFSFLSEPVTNGFSRWEEHAADVFGQEALHGIVADPQSTAQQAFQVLGEESLDDPTPRPLLEFWTFSHPSIAKRLAFAAGYDPWAPGKEPKYFRR